MPDVCPGPIKKLPQADIPLDGVTACLSQSQNHHLIVLLIVPQACGRFRWDVINIMHGGQQYNGRRCFLHAVLLPTRYLKPDPDHRLQ